MRLGPSCGASSCASTGLRAALAAARRGSRLTEVQLRAAIAELQPLVGDLYVVPVTDDLVASAAELADTEGLRGHDAVHLAAALTVEATVLSSADGALGAAAARHGLHIADPFGS